MLIKKELSYGYVCNYDCYCGYYYLDKIKLKPLLN